ncbi:MAG TPA: hypothetical protein VFP17_05290 [Solirubrobacterales bacterium]|nr:hypothetical protein [Solirubrobacterales bacterium]
MDFKKLADKAKKTIDDRGGVESLKADAEELKKVAQGKGSFSDKAKAAAKAIKAPGEHRQGKAAHAGKEHAGGEKHPAQHAGNPEDTVRKGGPPHAA